MYYKLAYTVYFLFPQDIYRSQKISALNGKEFSLLDVIAHILHHLKDQLLIELRDHGKKLKASDFDWVITVPAIWKDRARELMLEAGYMVCLKLKLVYNHLRFEACLQIFIEEFLVDSLRSPHFFLFVCLFFSLFFFSLVCSQYITQKWKSSKKWARPGNTYHMTWTQGRCRGGGAQVQICAQ